MAIRNLTGWQLWCQLLHVATLEESDALQSMAVRAGLLWVCSCGIPNNADEGTCADCRRDKGNGDEA